MDAFIQLRTVLAHLLEVNDEPMVQEGLERTSIEQRFESVGLVPPAELVRMYELHDGIFHLNAFLHFLPLSEAIENYTRYAEISSEGGLSGWRVGLFPVFDLNGDIQICVDLATHEVVSVDIEVNSTFEIASDYESLIAAIAEVFQVKASYFDEQSGSVRFDPEQWARIAARHGVSPPW